ncbi:AMP-binding protein [Micrococcus sp.]|uniref:AMP-binding protein n=1 Tax=Micrococcus sp. TaxID=1271 RepID=UPI002A9187EC|nr:AMP-binding protein [Micrococcus sp.]MDY6055217.1 AMP-binding protein [Micrococcus sp.]
MPVSPAALLRARDALAAAFEGSGPPVELTADGQALPRPEARDAARGGHPDAVAVVRTSGSTGTPKQTVLTGAALTASARATARRLGGEGTWLLALGLGYVAGLAVLSRSVQAGTVPVALPPGRFTAEGFAEAAGRLHAPNAGARIVSLVPTQLARLLAPNAGRAGLRALAGFDHVLVGGARLDPRLRERAEAAGVPVTATYGMSETCGGCVYDGVPLPGVRADLVADPADPDAPARLRLSGPMVAAGYLDDPVRTVAHFGGPGGSGDGASTGEGSARWYLTEDTGTVLSLPGGTQQVAVTGRVDDVVNTGGVKVSAAAVQAVIEADDAVAEAAVLGVPDPEWGQAVAAAVVPADPVAWGEAQRRRVAGVVREALGPAAVPRRWRVLDALPLLPQGKTDRQRLHAMLS